MIDCFKFSFRFPLSLSLHLALPMLNHQGDFLPLLELLVGGAAGQKVQQFIVADVVWFTQSLGVLVDAPYQDHVAQGHNVEQHSPTKEHQNGHPTQERDLPVEETKGVEQHRIVTLPEDYS